MKPDRVTLQNHFEALWHFCMWPWSILQCRNTVRKRLINTWHAWWQYTEHYDPSLILRFAEVRDVFENANVTMQNSLMLLKTSLSKMCYLLCCVYVSPNHSVTKPFATERKADCSGNKVYRHHNPSQELFGNVTLLLNDSRTDRPSASVRAEEIRLVEYTDRKHTNLWNEVQGLGRSSARVWTLCALGGPAGMSRWY